MAAVTAPRTLADGRVRLVFLPTLKDPAAPTAAELEAGTDLSCRVMKSDFRASPVASETISGMNALCETSNASAPGQSNYEVMLTVFRWFDPANPGKMDKLGDAAYQALKVKGTHGYLVKRESGKDYSAPFAADDEIEVYEIVTDNPQSPSDPGGFIRKTIPTFVQNAWVNAAVKTG